MRFRPQLDVQKKAIGKHRIGRMVGQSRKFIPELSAQEMLCHSSK